MRFWLVLLSVITVIVWLVVAMAQTDLDAPAGPSDYAAGFFGVDARGLSDSVYQLWFDPGDEFCRVYNGRNCDATVASPAQVAGALATWEAMSRCNRLRLRAFHRAQLKWDHASIEKVHVFFLSSIPLSKRSQWEACVDPATFDFLGRNFSTTCAALNARSAGLCGQFFPGEQVDTVVSGWEDARN